MHIHVAVNTWLQQFFLHFCYYSRARQHIFNFLCSLFVLLTTEGAEERGEKIKKTFVTVITNVTPFLLVFDVGPVGPV